MPVPLQDIVRGVLGFSEWSHAKKMKFFAWYVHSHLDQERFNQADIRACYDALHLDKPKDVSPYLAQLENKKPREVIKDRRGFYLEGRVREAFESKYGQRDITVQVTRLLAELPSSIPSLEEKDYLDEAIICFKHGAYRAAIVMCWNLAYDHLCDYVLNKHLTSFNAQLPKSYKNADISAISVKDDFQALKEDQVLQVCKSANIVSNSLHKILKEKLARRNVAAHPSNVKILQYQAEDFITDLINNVVLKLV